MPNVIQKYGATAALRRIPMLIYSDSDGTTPWSGSVTGVKAQLCFLGVGSPSETASTADIVRVGGAVHYVELTQNESNTATGVVTARVVATTGRLEGVGAAEIVDYEPHTAGPTTAQIAAGVLDEPLSTHTTAGTLGHRLQSLRTGTAQAGAAGTITLDSSASASDDFYKNALILITAGTGAGQSRTIATYTGSSKVATVTPNWVTAPSNNSVFVILPAGSIAGATAPTAAEVADAVWDEARSGHVGGGSFGEGVILKSCATGAITAGGFATDAITANALAADAIGASELATDAVNEIRDAIFARAFSAAYGSHTFDELMKLISATLLGKASGMATTTATFRNLADTANAVVATVDADGNRSAVTRTP